jgi:aspartyl-tRNA(Asn)/glutamyl-tRNA(Gln) amidotransferase subunit A
MADLDLATLTIAAAGKALRARAVSPLELTEAYLARIAALNPRVNAFISVTAERALEDARRAEDALRSGATVGPLHGIPIAHKDLYETAGIRTTGGGKVHEHHVPASDCTVARRLRDAGTVLLGKLNTHEYAFGVTTNNPHYGPTRNPWDLERSPAGSSGGSGAAIAAGLATATTGTDTGGSIRMPASVCGVVGLKPTYGRVSKAGVLPLSYLFDHAGPITRTVEDAALMLNAMAGYDPADATTLPLPAEDFTAQLHAGARGVRIGVPRAHFFEHLGDGIGDALEAAIAEWTRLGAEVREVHIPGVAEGIGGVFGYVVAEAQEIHAHAIRTRLQDFGADLRALLGGPCPDAATLMLGLRALDKMTVAMRSVLEDVDVLLTPTTPITAPRIGEDMSHYGGLTEPVMNAMIRCTAPFNGTHLPALSLPCGFTRDGLPIGMQLAGRPFAEALLVRLGHAFEQATPWHLRTPGL